jgi:Family of unknown function (DUF6090)
MIKFFRKIRQNMIKENKVSKYMLYAIGEIVLVVIGILIALSINNWNEDRKLKNELGLFQASLISELNKDVSSITKELNLLNDDIKKLDNYFQRMSSESVTKDTLVKIFNIEFNPVIYGAIKFNNNTVNTLKASGYFSKLEKWLQDDIVNILEMKENYFTTHSDIANYVDLVTLNGNNYPRSIGPLKKSSVLNKRIWQNVDFAELGGYINNVFGVKYLTSNTAKESLQRMNIAIITLLQKLKAQATDNN